MDRHSGFRFGLETEFLLVDALSFRPLWHPDLTFETLNSTLEAIPVDDFQCDGFKVEPPHRKSSPYVVEGYHLPDPDMNPIDLLPKGVEIRTPICASIDECLASLKVLHARLQQALQHLGFQAVVLSFHPTEGAFQGPQNKRRRQVEHLSASISAFTSAAASTSAQNTPAAAILPCIHRLLHLQRKNRPRRSSHDCARPGGHDREAMLPELISADAAIFQSAGVTVIGGDRPSAVSL